MGGREGWEGRTLAPGGCFHPQSVPPASSQPALSAMEEKGGGTGVGGAAGRAASQESGGGKPSAELAAAAGLLSVNALQSPAQFQDRCSLFCST